MGNRNTRDLKDEYISNKYTVKGTYNEQLLGQYSILQFHSNSSELYIRKEVDPNQYDQCTDITDLLKALRNSSPHLCSFVFVESNATNPDNYDLLFEYGNKLIIPLKNENIMWELIEQISNCILFLEHNNLHYPFVHKNHIIQIQDNKFKLINPHCFSAYLKEMLQIYLNPLCKMSNRKLYSETQIKRNIKELGVLIITVIKDHSVKRLLKEPNYWREGLANIKKHISSDLERFIIYLLEEGPNMPTNFKDVTNWLQKRKPMNNRDLETSKNVSLIFVENKRLSSATPMINHQEEPKMLKVTLSPLIKNTLEVNVERNIGHANPEYKKEASKCENIMPIENKGPQRLSVRNALNNAEVDHQVKQIRHTVQHVDNNTNKQENRLSLGNRESSRDRISQCRYTDYTNKTPTNNNLNYYLQRKIETNEQTFNNNVGNIPNNRLNIQQNYDNRQTITNRNFRTANTYPDNRHKSPSVEIPKIIHQNTFPLSEAQIFMKPNIVPQEIRKVIRKVLIKCNPSNTGYQKTIEYIDGTFETVPMTQDDDNKVKQINPYFNNAPQNQFIPRPSINKSIDRTANLSTRNSLSVNRDQPQYLTSNNFFVMTLSVNNNPPRLLFKRTIKSNSDVFKNLSIIVDQKNPLKPSFYHPFDDYSVPVNQTPNDLYGRDNGAYNNRIFRTIDDLSRIDGKCVIIHTREKSNERYSNKRLTF